MRIDWNGEAEKQSVPPAASVAQAVQKPQADDSPGRHRSRFQSKCDERAGAAADVLDREAHELRLAGRAGGQVHPADLAAVGKPGRQHHADGVGRKPAIDIEKAVLVGDCGACDLVAQDKRKRQVGERRLAGVEGDRRDAATEQRKAQRQMSDRVRQDNRHRPFAVCGKRHDLAAAAFDALAQHAIGDDTIFHHQRRRLGLRACVEQNPIDPIVHARPSGAPAMPRPARPTIAAVRGPIRSGD